MDKKTQIISYSEFSNLQELPGPEKELLQQAEKAIAGSYAPYSHFNVGAAVRLRSGQIVRGANQENAAYPSGLCAERTAIFAAGANYPDDPIVEIAIMAAQNGTLTPGPVSPCGSCRQVMIETQKRSGDDIKVLLAGSQRALLFDSVSDILPFAFDNL